MSQQDEDTISFIYTSMIRHAGQLSVYDANNRRRKMLDRMVERLGVEQDLASTLAQRIRSLEAELAACQPVLDWWADRREVLGQLLEEELRASGMVEGLRDKAVDERLDTTWRALRKDPEWERRREALTKERLAAPA